jgi:hypothetical protein
MGVTRRRQHAVLGPPIAAGVLCLCNGSIDTTKVFGMNEAPRLVDRPWREGMRMKLCKTRIACKLAGG